MTYRSARSCACSASPSRVAPQGRRDAEAEGLDLDAARDHHLPAAGGDRDRHHVSSPTPRPSMTGSWGSSARSPRSTRFSRSTARRSTTRSLGRLAGHMLATAESCTAGLLAARLTDRAGSSEYFLGGGVVYSNQAKVDLAGPRSRADRARRRGVHRGRRGAGGGDRACASRPSSVSGSRASPGPGGGTPEKPVGPRLHLRVVRGRHGGAGAGGRFLTRRTQLPGQPLGRP